jgi:hypothetical protein
LSQPKRVTPVATGTLYTPAHPFLVALVLLCLWIVILSLPMWSGKFLAGPWSDQLKAGYAIRYWGAEQWRITGHPPQWNPNLVGGVPVFAGFGDLFYWTAWLRLFLPTVFAMNLAFIIHYLLAAVFMYALLRKFDFTWTSSVLGGTAYQLSGVIITYASPGHDGKLFVTALLPLMLIALVMGIRQRRWEGFALLALAVGLALLSPQYQATQYALIASGIFALYLTFGEPQQLTQRQQWTGLGLAAAGVAVGFGLSLVQVLPFTHYIQHSARSESAGYAWSTSYAMPWIHVPELLLAGFTGAKETYFGPNILKLHSEYLGLPVVALALLGLGSSRRRLAQWTGAMTLLFLLVALGNATPFYRLWYALVPYVNKTRAPGMALYVVSAATAVLAACGTERLERGEGERHAKIYLAAAGIIALLALAGVWGAIGQSYAAAHPEMGNAVGVSAAQAASQAQDGIRWGAFGSAIALAALGALVLAARRSPVNPAAFAVILPLIVGADLWRAGRDFWMWSRPEQGEYAPDPITQRLTTVAPPYRVLDLNVYPHATLMRFGVAQLLGYHGFELRYFDELLDKQNNWRNVAIPRTWGLFALRYIILPESTAIPAYHRVLGPVNSSGGGTAYLYEADTSPAYARVVPGALKLAADQVTPALLSPQFPVNQLALIDSSQAFTPAQLHKVPPPSPSKATVEHWAPGRMTLALSPAPPETSFVLVSENWYSDWHATVDGTPAPVLRGDETLILVVVPPGAHRIELTFDSRDYHRGLRFTWGALFVIVVGLVVPPVMRRRSRHGG